MVEGAPKKLEDTLYKPRGCSDFARGIEEVVRDLYANVYSKSILQAKKDFVHDGLAGVYRELLCMKHLCSEGEFYDR